MSHRAVEKRMSPSWGSRPLEERGRPEGFLDTAGTHPYHTYIGT